ncbi:MAG: hypothetical protein JNK57_12285 [Planctomycetaceae bacterium]|nr:hypothetical protein [Planctomycetaceae bacterium]
MTTIVERMLRENLARNADYKTTQLLKSGRIAAAATEVLNSRRSMLKWMLIGVGAISFFACLTFLVITIASVIQSQQGTTPNSTTVYPMIIYCLVLFPQLLAVSQWRFSLARLEMLLLLWLQEEPGSVDLDRTKLEEQLTTKTLGVF